MKRILACVFLLGACGGDPPPPETSARARPIAVEEGVLRMAGSGSMGPLGRALAAAFAHHAANTTGLRPIVEDSIGSGGGIRAVADGAVDVGMVSRPLGEAEKKLGLALFAAGSDAVVIAANVELPVDDLPSEFLLDLFSGTRRTLLDGSPVTVLMRDPGESANLVLDAAVPGMQSARERGYRIGFRVIYRDEGMAGALFGSRNAIGLSSLPLLKSARMPLKALGFDGRRPPADAADAEGWPMTRALSFVARPERVARLRPFFDFVGSDAGRAVIAEAGYYPPKAPAR